MTGTSTKKWGPDGFTLLEIVVSMGLIAIALTAVFRLQASNLDIQAEARFVTVATQLAQERISRIRAMKTLAEGTMTGDFGESFPGFSFQEEITEVLNKENLFQVKVSIMLERSGTVSELTTVSFLYHTLMGEG